MADPLRYASSHLNSRIYKSVWVTIKSTNGKPRKSKQQHDLPYKTIVRAVSGIKAKKEKKDIAVLLEASQVRLQMIISAMQQERLSCHHPSGPQVPVVDVNLDEGSHDGWAQEEGQEGAGEMIRRAPHETPSGLDGLQLMAFVTKTLDLSLILHI